MRDFSVSLIGSGDPRWWAALKRVRHDIFHVPSYLRAQDNFLGTVTQLLTVEDDEHLLLVPIILQSSPEGFVDATSPQEHSSPVFSEGATLEWRHEAIRAMLSFLRSENVVSLFLRFHPLLDAGVPEFSRFGAVVAEGPTFVIRLDRPAEAIRSGMRENHRRNIRKARAAGQIAERDADWEHLAQFHWIYTKTMERLGADAKFFHTLDQFEEIRDEAGEYASLWVLKLDGQLAGAHLVTECDGTVQYLMGATHPDYHHKVPQVAIFDAVLSWAEERGNRHYFLGGGKQESLRHFKAGFTDVQRQFYTARIVIDPVRYGRACEEWESATGQRISPSMDAFFPPYRRPQIP